MVSQVLGLVSEVVRLGSEVFGLGFKVLAPPDLDLGALEAPGLGYGVLEPLRAVPRCVEVRFGENQWWVGRQTTHLNGNDLMKRFVERDPEFTPPNSRPEAPPRANGAKRRPQPQPPPPPPSPSLSSWPPQSPHC